MLPTQGAMYLMMPMMSQIMVLLIGKGAGSFAGKQGKCKRGAAESNSAGCRLPCGKTASLFLSSVFIVSAIVPLLQQQWQEQKEGQHMLPDLGACAAAFCLAEIVVLLARQLVGMSLLQGAHKQTAICPHSDA